LAYPGLNRRRKSPLIAPIEEAKLKGAGGVARSKVKEHLFWGKDPDNLTSGNDVILPHEQSEEQPFPAD